MSYQELRGGNVDSEGRMRCFAKTERCTLCILQHPPKVKTVDGKKARGCQGGSLRMVSWSQEDIQGRRKKILRFGVYDMSVSQMADSVPPGVSTKQVHLKFCVILNC